MGRVSISEVAAEHILKERDKQAAVMGRRMIPRLLYYRRSYSKLHDGQTIEHGSGLSFSFIKDDEVSGYQYLPVELGNGCIFILGPSAFFQSGEHSIDWVDQRFRITSLGPETSTS